MCLAVTNGDVWPEIPRVPEWCANRMLWVGCVRFQKNGPEPKGSGPVSKHDADREGARVKIYADSFFSAFAMLSSPAFNVRREVETFIRM